MLVKLPSSGVLGCSVVDLQIPKYKHLRDISQLSLVEDQVPYNFVKSLLSDPSKTSQMTYQDINFLFIIAVSAMHMNSIEVRAKCRCGEPCVAKYALEDKEVTDLPENTPKVLKKELSGVEYGFKFLSADEEQEVVSWALEKSNYDVKSKLYNIKYTEAFVCKTFGYDLSDESVSRVSEFEVLLYYTPLLFRTMMFHGVEDFVTHVCPKCGRKLMIKVPFAQSVSQWSSADLVNEFTSVSKIVGFSEFLDLTFAELSQLRANQQSGAI